MQLWRNALALVVVVATIGMAPATSAAPASSVQTLDQACPTAVIAEDGFTDVPQSSVHERAVDCITWWRVTTGSDWGGYLPADPTSRAANASFVARALTSAGTTMPTDPPDAFDDDNGSIHEPAINDLAAIGVVEGTGPRQFSPTDLVTRGQMASMLDRAYAARTGQPLPPGPDAFDDDNGSVHEDAINAIAAVGLAAGTGPRTFEPDTFVRRDQMASFLARLLDLFVQQGFASPPSDPPPPRNSRYAYYIQFGCGTYGDRRLDGSGTITEPNAECGGTSYFPRLSPDGRLIASAMGPYVKLWHADGSGSDIVFADENRLIDVAGWTPDGRAVIVDLSTGAVDFRGYPQAPWEQRVVPLDGSPSQPYRTTTQFQEHRSPFGDFLTYSTYEQVTNCSARWHAYVVALPAGAPREVFTHDIGCGTDDEVGGIQTGLWLPDEAHLFFGHGTTSGPVTGEQGFLVDLATGGTTEMPLIAATGDASEPHYPQAITPDGRSIIWECARPNVNYYSHCISDLSGANYRLLPGPDDITGTPGFPSA